MPEQEVLAEGLAGFEARPGLQRTVGLHARGFEDVDDAMGQGHFGADDDELRTRAADEVEDRGAAVDVDLEAFGFKRHAAVAGSDADLPDAGAPEAGLEQRMLTAA